MNNQLALLTIYSFEIFEIPKINSFCWKLKRKSKKSACEEVSLFLAMIPFEICISLKFNRNYCKLSLFPSLTPDFFLLLIKKRQFLPNKFAI